MPDYHCHSTNKVIVAGSEINSLTWSLCGDFTKIFGRQVSRSGRQKFFPFPVTIKRAKMHVLDISKLYD